jgi:hypothetical protein
MIGNSFIDQPKLCPLRRDELSLQGHIFQQFGVINRKPPGVLYLMEASYCHLLVTPPSHFTPQKVRGFVVGFTGQRGVTAIKKYSYGNP